MSKKKKPTTTYGQRPNAGRKVLKRPNSQIIAFRILTVASCIALLLSQGGSTLSDPLQKLVAQSVASISQSFSDHDTQKRASLLRYAASRADAIENMTQDEIAALFGVPEIKRREGESEAWQYRSQECALDIYFKQSARKASYVEYRLRDSTMPNAHQLCIRTLFSAAKFDAPQQSPTPIISPSSGGV